MNIYLVSQTENTGYDTYDSFICYANSEEEARNINPDGEEWGYMFSAWCSSPDNAIAIPIGYTDEEVEPDIILASFNAG